MTKGTIFETPLYVLYEQAQQGDAEAREQIRDHYIYSFPRGYEEQAFERLDPMIDRASYDTFYHAYWALKERLKKQGSLETSRRRVFQENTLAEIYATAQDGDESAREKILKHFLYSSFPEENWGEVFEKLGSKIDTYSFLNFTSRYGELKKKLQNPQTKEISFGLTPTDLKENLSIITTYVDPADSFDRTDLHSSLDSACLTLSEQEQNVIKLYYIDGLKCPAIADMFGLTKSRIQQILASAKSRLYHPIRSKYLKDYYHTPDRSFEPQGRVPSVTPFIREKGVEI